MRSIARPAPAAAASARAARVGDREPQRLALRRGAILQVEPDAVDRRRAGLHRRVGDLAGARDVVERDLDVLRATNPARRRAGRSP